MTPPPQPEYIITEKQLKTLVERRGAIYISCQGKFRDEIVTEVRSHPYQSSRDKVLDAFKEVIRLHDEDELLYPDLYNEFLVIYKSQWKQAGEP
jgi:hypothetical protein